MIDRDAESKLVLYGSLRAGQASFEELGLASKLQPMGPVFFRGVLFDLGEYPGLILSISGKCTGELYRVSSQSVWSELDQFERYDPRDRRALDSTTNVGSLYTRETVPYEDANGQVIGYAQVYQFNGEIVDGVWRSGKAIAGGDWLKHIAARDN